MVKKVLGKSQRGPEAVFLSLQRGFHQLAEKYEVNAPLAEHVKSAGVLSGVMTLRWVIKQKQAGEIKKIIAGPNLVVTPKDSQGVLLNPSIDTVIVPCQWVKDFYIKVAPQLAPKIQIWPGGVEVKELTKDDKIFDFLVFNKLGQKAGLASKIIGHLEQQGYKLKILTYGSFKQQDYFNSLNKSKNLIYLSVSESQGLAMFEAWARGVPTLLWDKGFFELGGVLVQGFTSSPYLAPQAGERFKDFDDFILTLPKFLNSSYASREYVLNNFSDKICAQKYLDIFYEA